MKNRKSILILILSLFAAVMILSACSSGEATEAPAAPAPTEGAVEPVEPTAEEPTAEAVDIMPTAAPGEATLTAKENVRVRSGPSQQYPIYAKLAGGETAKLLGVSADGTYYAIEVTVVAPNTGWVDANFAEVSGAEDLPVLEAPPVPPTSAFTPVEEGQPTVIALDAVFVNSGPGEQYPVYGIAEAGSKGLVIGVSEDGAWWVVRINPEVVGNGYSWVNKEFVTTDNVGDDLPVIKTPPVPTAGDLPAPDPNGPYGIATVYLNVRSGPGTNYPVLAIAPPNDSGVISGKSSDGQWWQVEVSTDLSANGYGWVHGAYVQTFNVTDVPVVEAPAVPPTNPNPPQGSLSCLLVSQFPEDGTVLGAGEAFDMAWEVQNVGEETWTVSDSAATKVGAVIDQPLSTVNTLPLAVDVATGDTYVVTVPMTAPDVAGQFGEYWVITSGEETVCYFYNVIRVEE
jgi:uncharacterized protein YraI